MLTTHLRKSARTSIIVAAISIGLAAGALLAAPGVVITQTGQRFEGEVTERGDDVVINIRGVQTIIDRADVVSIEYSENFQKEMRDRLAKLDPNDVQGRVDLARWAMQKQQYTAARDLLDAAGELDPNNAEIVQLQAIVRGHLKLMPRNAEERAQPLPGVAPRDRDVEGVSPATPQAATQPHRNLLTPEQIQEIRRAEWRPGDVVRVRVDRKSARAYAERHNRPWRDFGGRRVGEQAAEILANGAPDEMRAVTILSDPPAILEFRRAVQPMVLSGCAASGCHGLTPTSTAKFLLVAPADSEAAAYTNFYLLTTTSRTVEATGNSGGIFGGATEVRMIERGTGSPEKSLLIQSALPTDVAEFDHPKVPNWQPLAQTLSDNRARAMLDWMRSLKPTPPDYGFTFSLIGEDEDMTPATLPALPAAPASQPSP